MGCKGNALYVVGESNLRKGVDMKRAFETAGVVYETVHLYNDALEMMGQGTHEQKMEFDLALRELQGRASSEIVKGLGERFRNHDVLVLKGPVPGNGTVTDEAWMPYECRAILLTGANAIGLPALVVAEEHSEDLDDLKRLGVYRIFNMNESPKTIARAMQGLLVNGR